MSQVNKVISRETVEIVETFTNGFAQKVYKLANGVQLFVNYGETEVEIVTTDPRPLEPQEVTDIINKTPEEEA